MRRAAWVRGTDRILGRPPRGPRPAWLPAGPDDLVLRAALRADADGRSAWDAYCAWAGVPSPEHERLLPLVAATRAADSPDGPLLARGRARRRHTRVRLRWLVHAAAPVLGDLATDGRPVMVLKGLPLALRHYHDPGLRPLHDVDVLVRPRDFAATLDRLRSRGYTTRVVVDPAFVVDARGVDLEAPGNGPALDLHWQVHRSVALRGAPAAWGPRFFDRDRPDDPVWARSVPLEVGGATVRAPSAADLLVHVIAHGAAVGREPALRWAADAAVLIRGGGVDWDVLVADAARRGVTPEIADALGYLADALGVAVPADARARLDAIAPGRRTVVAYAARTGPPPPTRMRLRRHALTWAARTATEPIRTSLVAIPRYAAALARRDRTGAAGAGSPTP
jgi:hypothetical protein